MLATENQRRRRRPAVVRELAERLGYEPSRDDFLALEATEELGRAIEEQAQYHLVWHRIWGDRLAGEVAATVRALADRLGSMNAYLLTRDPPEAICVPAAAMLRSEADRLSRRTDLVLITGDQASGLQLTWDHLSHADEYSLCTWGVFALDLSS